MPILLLGDFNGRTGTLNEFMNYEENNDIFDPKFFQFHDMFSILNSFNIPTKRSNLDQKVNQNGKDLIDMCKYQDLCILNGRIGMDSNIGSTTCADKSAIDYAISTHDLLKHITNFTVDKFDPLLSDKHNPIILNLNLAKPSEIAQNTYVSNNNSEVPIEEPIVKCKWDKSKKLDFLNNFDKNKINNISNNLSAILLNDITQTTVENISNDLSDILIEPAKKTKMYKQVRYNTNKRRRSLNKPWFNTSCKNSKNQYNKFKNSLPSKPSELDKSKLKDLAKITQKIIKKGETQT